MESSPVGSERGAFLEVAPPAVVAAPLCRGAPKKAPPQLQFKKGLYHTLKNFA